MVIQAPETAHLRRSETKRCATSPTSCSRGRLTCSVSDRRSSSTAMTFSIRSRSRCHRLLADLVPELLIHSALRRRATLFFWLALSGIDARSVSRILHAALRMSDRDKSDMASALPLVASLYLGATDYAELVGLMATSSYADISDAAMECVRRSRRRSQLLKSVATAPSTRSHFRIFGTISCSERQRTWPPNRTLAAVPHGACRIWAWSISPGTSHTSRRFDPLARATDDHSNRNVEPGVGNTRHGAPRSCAR